MSICPVTLHRAIPVGNDGNPRAVAYSCGRPVVRMGLCVKHAADHEQLCDGCQRCGGEPDERFPCGCVRYGDRWVPDDCSVHVLGGLL
jgi:hypothetical protein